jgi:hypothetical protein
MPPLTQDTQRTWALHQPQILPLPAAAGSVLFVGALIATNAAGQAVPASDTAGLKVQGVCREGLNNANGAAGNLGATADFMDAVRYIRVDAQGEWLFDVSAGTPTPGANAFVVNDNTVSAAPTANSIIAGKFTRPYSISNGSPSWFVDLERR